jgi:SAM-dependent methyltransferase
MKSFKRQTEFWNRVADDKRFTSPLDGERLGELVPKSADILDVGCGYGRTCADLKAEGYTHAIGVDIASNMIERGHRLYPDADLRLWEGAELPFAESTFDAVLIFTVLTCIPSDVDQRKLIADIERVLRPNGVLYISDFFIQGDARNQKRYDRFAEQYDSYGVFELPEGVVLRHHSPEWVDDLLSSFQKINLHIIDVPTMNGNISKVFQYFGRKQRG